MVKKPRRRRRLYKKMGNNGVMRKRAFSLVELLVVIGIIAVLVAVLLPALTRARAAGYALVCWSNLRQIFQASLQRSIDHDGYVQVAGSLNFVASVSPAGLEDSAEK